MNLNPEAVDDIKVKVFSDSDSAGIFVVATETDDESALFVATILATQTDKSSGNRLRALPGDVITAKYKDRTLAPPYNTSDEIELATTAKIGDAQGKVELQDVYFADSSGNKILNIQADKSK